MRKARGKGNRIQLRPRPESKFIPVGAATAMFARTLGGVLSVDMGQN